MKRKGYNLDNVIHLILHHYLDKDEQKQKEYEQMARDTGLSLTTEDFDEFIKNIGSEDTAATQRRARAYQQFYHHTHKRILYIRPYVARTVAVIVLLLTIGGGAFWFFTDIRQATENIQKTTPPYSKIYLTLSDGSQINLSEASNHSRIDKECITICNSGLLEYERQTENTGQPVAFNQISVPRGGEYRLILSDGSKVWINAQSEIKYPVKFGSGQREIYIQGEVYLEINKDSLRPFIVHTSKGTVRVLGTEFNIRDYEDEAKVVTTLVKGTVEYQNGNTKIKLEPGFQSIDTNNQVSTKQVNIEEFTGWKDGKYIFYNETLGNLMKYIERTYDFDIFFANENVKQLRFSGDLQRYGQVELFLRYLENGGDVRFKISNQTIIVYKK